MKMIAGVLAASAMLVLAPAGAGAQPKGTPNYYGYVPHQKTGGNHPGGHSSVYGHKKNAGSYSGGGHVHNGCHGHPQKPVARCFPPGHCKSINKGYYGPPGQKGR
ncbi:MAG TPA: hypothetical protein VF699_04230 [Caulobacteraceae bacterium]|jgi:hypothetical protein